jgi:hypothetical protein
MWKGLGYSSVVQQVLKHVQGPRFDPAPQEKTNGAGGVA